MFAKLKFILRHLPKRFTAPLFVFGMLSLIVVGSILDRFRLDQFEQRVVDTILCEGCKPTGIPLISSLLWISEAAITVAVLSALFLGSYNLAVFLYKRTRPAVRMDGDIIRHPDPRFGRMQEEDVPQPSRVLEAFKQYRKLEDLRIGLILAGGGAKGAYQAGALRAIYEFLAANGALNHVRMIAGTSIGAWNSMFWLAGLIHNPEGMSPHERWWRHIDIKKILEFDYFWPFTRNAFFTNMPWREEFRSIFLDDENVRTKLEDLFTPHEHHPIHFYFTRTNVETGHLEFATNNPAVGKFYPGDRYQLVPDASGLEDAVFASMDIPPLFPYSEIKDKETEFFEDGGVAENLPLRFGTQIDNCNLLFVLPLNASFSQRADHKSVIKRLVRVVDVRQGVLERNSLKLAKLYNRRARMVRKLTPEDRRELDVEHVADPVSVMAICPENPIIGTTEFWKHKEAGVAFERMYAATDRALEADAFVRSTDPYDLNITLVRQVGSSVYDHMSGSGAFRGSPLPRT